MQIAGSKDGGWVYTSQHPEVQNGKFHYTTACQKTHNGNSGLSLLKGGPMNFKSRLLCLPVALAITVGIGSKPVARTAATIALDVTRGLPDKLSQAKLIESYGKLPLSFEA